MTRLTDDDARQTLREMNTQDDDFPWSVWLWLAFCAACWWDIVRLWPW